MGAELWLVVVLVGGLALLVLLIRSSGSGKWGMPEIRFSDDDCRAWVSFEKATSSGVIVRVKEGGQYTLRFGTTSLRELLQRGVAGSNPFGYSLSPEFVKARAGEPVTLALLDKATRLSIAVTSPDRLRCTAVWNESRTSEVIHEVVVELVDDVARFQLPTLLQNQGETDHEKSRDHREILFRVGEASGEVRIPDFLVVRSNYPFRTESQAQPDEYTYQKPEPGDLVLTTYCIEGDTDRLQLYLEEYDGALELRRFEHPKVEDIQARLFAELKRQNLAAHDFLMHARTYDSQSLDKGNRLLGGG